MLRAVSILLLSCAGGGALADAVDEAACAAVAAKGNFYASFEALFVAAPPIEETQQEVVSVFGDDPNAETTNLWQIDFDADGIADHLAIDIGLSAWITGPVHFLSGASGAVRRRLELGEDDGDQLWVVSAAGRFYVLSGSESFDKLWAKRLWQIGEAGQFAPVCKLEQTVDSAELVLVADAAVCAAIGAGQAPAADYSLLHALGSGSRDSLFALQHPKEGLARVDIDDDGVGDNVVRLDFAPGWTRPCGGQFLAVTDDSRTELRATPLNRLLLENLGDSGCGPSLEVLVHDGRAYVEARRSLRDRAIYRIEGLKAEKICEFRERATGTFRMLDQPKAP